MKTPYRGPTVAEFRPLVSVITWIDMGNHVMYEATRNRLEPNKWDLVSVDLLRGDPKTESLPYTLISDVQPLTLEQVYEYMNAGRCGDATGCRGCDSTKRDCDAAIARGAIKCCPDCDHA